MENKKVVEEVKEEIKDEVIGEVIDEVVEEVKKENWFSKTRKWFSKHKNEVVSFAAGAATGAGLTAMILAGAKEELDSDDEIIVEVEEVTVEDEE